MLSPLRLRALKRRQSSGRCCFGSQRCSSGSNGKHAFLGPRLLFVATGASERRVEAVLVERLNEGLRFHDVGVERRAVLKRVDALVQSLLVDMDEQIEAEPPGSFVAERDHVPKLPGRIDVEQRKRRLGRKEGLHRQVQHHGAVLADGIQHDGPLALRDDLAHDVDAFGLETLKMRERRHARLCRVLVRQGG